MLLGQPNRAAYRRLVDAPIALLLYGHWCHPCYPHSPLALLQDCLQNGAGVNLPQASAVHIHCQPLGTGQVEDDETPEMIMAKFAELERIQKEAQGKAAAASAAAEPSAPAAAGESGEGVAGEVQGAAEGRGQDQALTDEQLMEVFKQTSMFNVKTALNDNEMLLAIDDLLDATEERYGSDEDFSEGEDLIKAFWSDDEDDGDLFCGVEEDEEGRRRRRRGGGMPRTGSGMGRALRGAAGAKGKHNVVTTFNAATQALIRRKVRVVDKDEILQLRIPPPPIPLAWGRTVHPYVPAELREERKMAVPCVGEAQPSETAVVYREVPQVCGAAGLASGAPYQAALISPGWEADGPDPLQRLSRTPLPKLVPTGFIFIWVQKQHIHQVCRLMNRQGYIYVENLTWVYLAPSAAMLALPSPLVRTSHLTLFIFRKEGAGKDIELRHQRNPDVTFDGLAREPSGASSVPEEAFVAIETLLPTGKGKFLELWAPRGVRRPGWTHFVEVGGPEN